jgi:hypothetical protein
MANAVHLSYSLTRVQRALNPWERLYYTFAGFFVLLLLSSLAVIILPLFVAIWIVLGIWASVLLVFGRTMLSFFVSLFSSTYINTVVIGDGYVSFGINGTDFTIPNLSGLRVRKGACGTMLIEHLRHGYAIVLPREAIALAELKDLIGGSGQKRCQELFP